MSLFEKLSILLSSVFLWGVLKKDVCFGVMIDYVEIFRQQLNVTSREEFRLVFNIQVLTPGLIPLRIGVRY